MLAATISALYRPASWCFPFDARWPKTVQCSLFQAILLGSSANRRPGPTCVAAAAAAA